MKDLAFIGYCVSVIGQCPCVFISHIDAYTWHHIEWQMIRLPFGLSK